jgi:hypothetical protein
LTCSVIGNTTDFGSVKSRFEPWQVNEVEMTGREVYPDEYREALAGQQSTKSLNFELYTFILSCGVIGNTSDSGSEEFRFEP